MRIVLRLPQVLVAIGLVSLGAVGVAAIAQHVFDMQPCPWCVLQRLIYIVVGVLALVAAALPGLVRRLFIVLALLGTLCGLASALWQQLHAVNEASCAMTLADRIMTRLQLDALVPQLFTAYASCADAAVSVLGVPFAVWSCLLYVILGLLLVWTLRVSLKSR
jgi:disulfide bond formation protein DsbB